MSYDKMDSPAVYAMFEEIKEKLSRQPAQEKSTPTPVPALNPGDIEKIERMTQVLNQVGGKLDRPLRHSHTIDLMSNKVLIMLVVVKL